MKTPYLANSLGVIGIAFAIAIALRGCSSILVEKQKTEQYKIKYDYEKGEER
jgi:uncharacterized protein YceK